MTDKKEWKKLREKLAQQGCTFEETKNCHTKIYNRSGELVTIMQRSKSDWRAHKNFTAQLRRNGIEI